MSGRIAVIEDEEPSREFLRQLLSGAGFSVGTASGGQEEIALVEREYPDLVILDLAMPGMMAMPSAGVFAAVRRGDIPKSWL